MKKHLLILLGTALICTLTAQSKKNNAISTRLNLMTFNIRYDEPKDGKNSWENRKSKVIQTILDTQADIIGFQESLHNQIVDLENGLEDFQWVGVGRDDGIETGEYSPIFYNAKKLEEVGSGYFWLSEKPFEAGSKGWDAACPRVATWMKLKEKQTGKIFFVLNTHLDHKGNVARNESVKLLLDKMNIYTKKNSLPAIVTGDFNAVPSSDVIKNMTDGSNPLHVTDSRSLSPCIKGPAWTFHDFGRMAEKDRITLDYIFVKNGVSVLNYEVIDTSKSAPCLSDHNAVMVKVEF